MTKATPIQPVPDLTGLSVYPELESNTLEFKQSLSSTCREKLFPTICAFLNTKGGRIIFGIEDTRREIVGLDAGSKDIDKGMLQIDRVYNDKQILDDEGKPPAIGSVRGYTVPLDKGRVLVVIDVQPSSGEKTYRTVDGACWYRLSASNYRIQNDSLLSQLDVTRDKNRQLELDNKDLRQQMSRLQLTLKDKEQEIANCKRQREFAYNQTKKVQEEFKTLAGAAKNIEERFDQLTSAIHLNILDCKEITEKEIIAESKRSWWCWLC